MPGGAEWSRVRALFEAALDVAAGQRAAWLADACGDDDALRREVERLLAMESDDATLAIDRAIDTDEVAASFDSPLLGHRIGAYVVEGLLGAGGMSTVFLARQERPRRRVALKTMRLGLTSEHARQRFAYESEVLARLRHPAIAQVFEVGTWHEPLSGEEQPFFAMELVDGARTLVQHAAEHRLDTSAILELFIRVCDGVEYGHRHGIVHRDLKPANILVDAHGHPKIIDFGIARALGDDREELTEAGQLLGTLQYMAPEQLDAGAEPLDTRADVYALGALLYELLTGEVPHRLGDNGMATFARRVQDEVVRPPSSVRPALPRELDWIVGMTLATDRDARYGSAAELVADLRRLLAFEPLVAGPPTTLYRLKKFARRNRALVAGSLTAVVLLIAGVATTAWQMVRAERARDDALRQARRAETVNRVLIGILEAGDPNQTGGSADLTVREALDRAVEQLATLGDQPEVEVEVRFALGNAYRSLGLLDDSEVHLRKVVEMRSDLALGTAEDLARAMNVLALTFDARGDTARAIEWTREALREFEAIHGPRHPTVAMAALNLGGHLIHTEDAAEGVDALRRAVSIYEGLPAEEFGGYHATALSHLAIHARERGDVDRATERFEDALAVYDRAGQGDHPYAAMTAARLGRLLLTEGRDLTRAAELLRSAVDVLAAAYGEDSVLANGPRALLGRALRDTGRPADAARELTHAERALAGAEPTDARSLLDARLTLSELHQQRGDLGRARDLAEGALQLAEDELDPEAVVRARARLAECTGGR